MNKILKSVRSVTNNKDDIIKKALISQLSSSCKEIHYAEVEGNKSPKTLEYLVSEAANALCTTIEAIFLHGLRDTLTHRFKKALADVDEQPEPSFWAPLLIISHRQIIDQITNLSQITTEVGQCRVWIRLALNDCLLSSYLASIRQDSSSLKSYYRVNSFLRDTELLDVAQRLIEGIETFKAFTLPFNSSLLNTWPLPSLILAGIWAPTLKTCPVAPCDDVLQSISISDSTKSQPTFENSSDTASVCSFKSYNSQSSGLRQIIHLPEDEVLKIILAKDNNKTGSNSHSFDDIRSASSSDQEKSNELVNTTYNVGNSVSNRAGWSSDESQISESSKKENVNTDEITPLESDSKSMENSFNALIESYNLLSGALIKTPDIREVWQKFEDKRKEISKDVIKVEADVPVIPVSSPKKQEISLAAQVGKIAREKGLDAHNYECADCRKRLEIDIKPKVCAFTGNYVCDKCISTELVQIPARIIHNWDFKVYPISKRAIDYLNEVKDHPIIDFKVLNPFIYGVVEEMANLQILRNQLNFLRAYLFTCREPVIEELQKQMWPREYMYEHIHQYSILDLSDVMNGLLAQQLEKVVAFGREHVYNCWLCSQKGFVCEICNKPKALFPFDVQNVFRCDICNAVYHKSCWDPTIQCRKCKRRKDREEVPMFGITTND